MKIKSLKKILILVGLNLILVLNYSAIIAMHDAHVFKKNKHDNFHVWSVYAYTGYAWSKNAGIVNPDPFIFANVAANDTDDGNLSNAPFGGVSFQRNISDWFSIGCCYEIYAMLNYQRYHINGTPAQENLGPKFMRQFLLNHQSFMLEAYLRLPEKWHLMLNCFTVKPLFSAAFGVGINDLFNFGTIASSRYFSGSINYDTVGSNFIAKSLAWRLEAGLRFSPPDSNHAFGVAYRYYCGGGFQSGQRYQFNALFDFNSTLRILPPWKGVLKANELKIYIETDFD